tara:strand:+ start:354 stop:503 length:150 start_codon:yes stop_codon:yes gene_type:complete
MENNNFYRYLDKIKTQVEEDLKKKLRNFDNTMECFYKEYNPYDLLYCMA